MNGSAGRDLSTLESCKAKRFGTRFTVSMSSESDKMRNSIIAVLVLLSVAGYFLHSLLAKESKEVETTPPREVKTSADFPISENPVDRSNRGTIVSFSDVLEDVNPAVVGVYPSRIVRVSGRRSNPYDDLLRRYFGFPIPEGQGGVTQERKLPQGIGSGVIISEDGYILTNFHVVTDERGNRADEILVKLTDEREFTAEVVGSDQRTDVAVLKIDAENLPFLEMADSDQLRVGDIVFAVGNPLGVGLTVTMGIVSAIGRSDLHLLGQEGYENFIQTDASINPGNSGGPLVDAVGRLVGINTAIISRSGGNIGIGFAIPIKLARNILLNLIESGTVQRGFLGVNITDLDPDMAEAFGLDDTEGALVEDAKKGLPAHEAGIRRGDVILEINRRKIMNVADLRLNVASTSPGTDVVVTVMRDGKRRDFEVTLGNLDDPTTLLGSTSDAILEDVSLRELSDTLRDEHNIEDDIDGLVVTEVRTRSPYSGTLRSGMVIVEINDRPVPTLASAQGLIRRGVNKLWVYDRGTYGFVAVRIR